MGQFNETQRLTQWWLYAILIGLLILPIFLWDSFDTKTTIFYYASIGLPTLFITSYKLKTDINKEHINISWFPFINRTIKWSDIKDINVIDYGFVGGWGVRILTGYGTVYNAKGAIGAHIKLINGKQLVIGTQKEQDMKQIIDMYWNQNQTTNPTL